MVTDHASTAAAIVARIADQHVRQEDIQADIEKALREAVEARWLPIESAPKDGSHILAYGEEPCRGGGFHVRETYWAFYGKGSIAKAAFDRGEGPSGRWEWGEPIHNWSSSWKPTYWMPLPAPPAAIREDQP